MNHACYVYIARADPERHPAIRCGWKCQCGAASTRANHPSREAAEADWTAHATKETK